jgi:hypothetical protein
MAISRINIVKLFIFVTLLFTHYLVSAEDNIHFISDKGDYIGGGTEQTLTGDFNVTIGNSRIYISHTSGYDFTFVAPNNRKLEYGLYLNAERAPFRGPLNPGLDIGSSGKGCNTISGEFVIYELEYENDQKKLALDFIQYCDSNSKKMTGSIRINSDLPTPYNLPFASINSSTDTVLEGTTVAINGSDSFSNESPIKSYLWEHVSGPELTILDVNAESTQIEAPLEIELGGEIATIRLTITNNAGQVSTSEAQINVSSKSDPDSYFTMNSEAGDYIGAGRDWHYSLFDSNITAKRNYDNGVSISINGSDRWSADFAAENEVELQPGEYASAERFPFQDQDIAGLSISGNGRGCNKSVGSFDVVSLVWENDQPVEFKATFEQHCEQESAPLLSGEVAFNAYHESVPRANAGADIEVLEGSVVNLNGSGSFDNLGEISTYFWSSPEPALVINNLAESRANFKSLTLADREVRKTVTARLLITDDEGYQSADSVKITVLANNSAPLAIPDTLSLLINESITLSPLMNDSDNDGRIIIDSIEITKAPQFGDVINNSDGTIIYKHMGPSAVVDQIGYTIKDNDGAVSDVAIITLSVQTEITEPKPDPEVTDPETAPEVAVKPEISDSTSGTGSLYWLWILCAFISFRATRISR